MGQARIFGQTAVTASGVDISGATATPEVVFSGYTFFAGATTEMQTGTALGPGTPLSEMPWEQISAISKSGQAQNYFQVGDQKIVRIGEDDYAVEIVGFNHDDLADGSGKAGITFGMVDCLNTTYALDSSGYNSGGWGDCEFRVTLQSTIFRQLSAELQSVILPVIKLASPGDRVETASAYTDTLFLFSEQEIFGQKIYSTGNEGVQYARFATQNDRKKLSGFGLVNWFLRSAVATNTTAYCVVDANGECTANGSPKAVRGIAFGFCV